MSDRRGFTLVELLIVAVLGALVVGATYQVLTTNQRTYTAQNAQVQGQQTVRAALEFLSSELREVSASGGDVLAMNDDTIKVRALRAFGVTCLVNYAGGPALTVKKIGRWFEDGDSVYVFADNDDAMRDDDAFFRATISSIDTFQICPDLEPAQRLVFANNVADFAADSVRVGAPIREFEIYTYGLFEIDGENYLGRRIGSDDPEPMVGPLREDDGLVMTYLDANGVETATPTDVRMIQVTLRTASNVINPRGGFVSDSITALIYTRN